MQLLFLSLRINSKAVQQYINQLKLKIMKTATNTAAIDQYIIDAINPEGYNANPQTDRDKLQFIVNTFKSEYGNKENMRYHGNNIKRVFISWIQGLPSSFNIDFENYQILNICYLFGLIPADATEAQEDKMLDEWWGFIYDKLIELCLKHDVKTP
jgi:hypothetical protein